MNNRTKEIHIPVVIETAATIVDHDFVYRSLNPDWTDSSEAADGN